ncbi:MAG: nucleotidyl transferase AbiEii/AbiGii toxin family protein [Candidatus Binatia bacterium]
MTVPGRLGDCYGRRMVLGDLHDIAHVSRRERARIAAARGEGMRMDEGADKIGALRDALRVLERSAAPCALIGGVAVGVRSGVARATMDTDLAVTSTADRAALVRALVAAGFTLRGEFAHSVNFRHSSGEPVQIVFDPTFDPMIARAEPVPMGDVIVRVVTTADLIAMKERAAGDPARPRSKALRDAADVALLKGDLPDPDEGW